MDFEMEPFLAMNHTFDFPFFSTERFPFFISILFVWIGSSLAYSDGYRSGRVIKVSKRGAVFKTIEGQLNNDSFGAIKGQNQFNQIFLFSVENLDLARAPVAHFDAYLLLRDLEIPVK